MRRPDALELWAGDGAVRLLRRDRSRRALSGRARASGRRHRRAALRTRRPRIGGRHRAASSGDRPAAVPLDRRPRPAAGSTTPRATSSIPLARGALRTRSTSAERRSCTATSTTTTSFESARGAVSRSTRSRCSASRSTTCRPGSLEPAPDTGSGSTLLERRLAAFVAAGLDEQRMRMWTVIRGAYSPAGGRPRRYARSSRVGTRGAPPRGAPSSCVRAGWSGSYGHVVDRAHDPAVVAEVEDVDARRRLLEGAEVRPVAGERVGDDRSG